MHCDRRRLKLANLNFFELHHVPVAEYELPYWYEARISELESSLSHPLFGNRLTLRCERPPKPAYDTYIVQILTATKLWVKDHRSFHDPVPRNLHNLQVIVWGFSSQSRTD